MDLSRSLGGKSLRSTSFATPRRGNGSSTSKRGRRSEQRSRSAAEREAKQVEDAARLSPVAYSNGTVFSLFGIRKDAGWLERRMVSANCKVRSWGRDWEREGTRGDARGRGYGEGV